MMGSDAPARDARFHRVGDIYTILISIVRSSARIDLRTPNGHCAEFFSQWLALCIFHWRSEITLPTYDQLGQTRADYLGQINYFLMAAADAWF
jgi:hypothetical protein